MRSGIMIQPFVTHARRRPSTYRPVLEGLEGRWVPAGPATFFQQANLVADQAGAALIHDPELVNGWGISLSPTGGAFWVSANFTGVSTLYVGDVNGSPFIKAGLTVSTPRGLPTGQVFDASNDFVVTSGTASGSSVFIFAAENGTITGWNPAVPLPAPSRNVQIGVADPTSNYTGLALANNGTGNFLYAADFRNGQIDVFNAAFAPTTLAGDFTDPELPESYRPYNIQNLGGKLFVTYARRDANGDGEPDGGHGFVSAFDLNGNFLERVASGDHLRAPWGLALAPAEFGPFDNALLVGNHGSGRINAYDPDTGDFLGQLRGDTGGAIEIDGLFGLAFGNGVSAGDTSALYFAAGPDGGAHGLFGSLRAVTTTEATGTNSGRRGSAAELLGLTTFNRSESKLSTPFQTERQRRSARNESGNTALGTQPVRSQDAAMASEQVFGKLKGRTASLALSLDGLLTDGNA